MTCKLMLSQCQSPYYSAIFLRFDCTFFIFIELYLWVGVTGGTEEGVWLLYNIHSWCHAAPRDL